jgi:cytochrome c553
MKLSTPLMLLLLAATPPAMAATPNELLAEYTAKAGAPASPERGQKFFTTNFGKEMGFSCSSCHGAVPVGVGQDLVREKAIPPLAPAANAKRFTDRSKVEFNFRLNCKDVVGRECTAGEKADLISWLLTLKP